MKTKVQLTSKSITIDDLKTDDYVGFERYNKKWFIIYADGKLIAISFTTKDFYAGFKTTNDVINTNNYTTVKDCILGQGDVTNVYRFDTASELFTWLAGR